MGLKKIGKNFWFTKAVVLLSMFERQLPVVSEDAPGLTPVGKGKLIAWSLCRLLVLEQASMRSFARRTRGAVPVVTLLRSEAGPA